MTYPYQSIDFLHRIVAIAKQAGQAIMPIYLKPRLSIDVSIKQDGSPVSEADVIAHHLLVKALWQLTPDWPCLSEEGSELSLAERQAWPCYWLIDPIDGTKEFLSQSGDFTVNIALIIDHRVVLGVVYAPATDECYFASQAQGSFKQVEQQVPQSLTTRAVVPLALTVAVSRRHGQVNLDALWSAFPQHARCQRGSSLKFCLIAEGLVDLYPRLAPTSEWDTAAAQCVLEQAGGFVTNLQGEPLRYNQRDSLINPHFIAFGDTSIDWLSYFR